jgi:hypothetical protein
VQGIITQRNFFANKSFHKIPFQIVLMEKLKYAIHFCKSIDTDDYARVNLGDPTSHTASEDNSDIESVIYNPLNFLRT